MLICAIKGGESAFVCSFRFNKNQDSEPLLGKTRRSDGSAAMSFLENKTCDDEDRILPSAGEYVGSPPKVEIIFFLSRRPVTKFDLNLLTPCLGRSRKEEVLRDLEELVEGGWVDKYPSGGHSFVYCLTSKEEKRQYALELTHSVKGTCLRFF